MRAVLSRDPHGPSVRVLQKLLHALETGGGFDIAGLSTLLDERCQLAVDVLRDWRQDCYHLVAPSAMVAGQGGGRLRAPRSRHARTGAGLKATFQ